MIRATCLSLALLIAPVLQAQAPKLDANRSLVAPPVSPEVLPDRAVVFRLAAPTATDAQLRFDGAPTTMTKDNDGVWSAKAGPLPPGVYDYAFLVGGAQFNAATVEVPGDPMPDAVLQDVPHGTVLLQTYVSKVQQRRRNLRVYLPPDYFPEHSLSYPVLYLYNGGDEAGWTNTGRAQVMLDNLIARGRAVPMILVMPNNNINSGNGRDAAYPAALDNLKVIEPELMTEIIPLIESEFRVRKARESRAIAGVSFGGGTAFGVGMRHLDAFAYVGEFGTGTFGGADTPPPGHTNYVPFEPDRIAPGMIAHLLDPKTKPRIFYMTVGDRDPRMPHQQRAYEDFKKAGVDVSFRTFPGGHEFKVFRPALADFATKIFK